MGRSKLANFLLFLLLTSLALSGVEGCGGSKKATDSGSGSECPSASVSASASDLTTKNSSWNQSVVLKGEGTKATAREITLVLSATNSDGVNGYFLSEDSTTPTSSSAWTAVEQATSLSKEAPLTLSETDGAKTVYSWFKDATESISPASCLALTLDTGAPTGSLTIDSGAAKTNALTVTVKISGTGTQTKITAYALSETDSVPAKDSTAWNTLAEPSNSISQETSFALSAKAGDHTVYGWLRGEAGQVSASFSAKITVEVTSLTGSILINSGAKSTTSRTVSLNLSGLGPNNITGYEVSESSTPSSYTSISNPSTGFELKGVSYTLSSGDGTKTVYLHLRDSSNTTASASSTITIDTGAPTGTLKLDSGAKLTVDSTVSAAITGSDAIGVTGYYISSSSTVPGVNDTGWTAITSTTSLSTTPNRTLTDLTGMSTQYLWLKDAAGNLSATISDGIEVVRIISTSSANDVGSYTSIAVDSGNNPYISTYRANTGNLLYYTLSGSILDAEVISQTGNVGAGTSIDVDSNNKLHIAYRDTTNSKLKYATNASGSWVTETIEDGGISPSIGVDSTGKVHVSHQVSNNVRYVSGNAGSWSSEVALSGQTFAITSSLTVGQNNTIHISAGSLSPIRLYYASNESGSWQQQLLDDGSSAGIGSSITYNGGTIYISYWQNNTIQLASNPGSGWSFTQIDSGIGDGPTSIGIDSGGKHHIVYYDANNDDLKYATDYSGSWVITTLDSSGDVGDFCDIAIDNNDRLHISYYDATNGDLKYITTAD